MALCKELSLTRMQEERRLLMRYLESVDLHKYRRSFSVTILTGEVLAFARLKTMLSVK